MLARDEARSGSEDVIRLVEPEHSRAPRRRWLAIALAVVLVAGVGFVLTRGGEPGVGTARELRQSMQVRSGNGEYRSVLTNPKVVAGDTVRTDRRGRGEIDYGDGSLTRLDSNTTFEVQELTKGARRVMDAKLTKGRVWNNVRKLASVDDRFQVNTPNAVATVRGTIFVCEVAPPRDGGPGVDTTCIQITGRTEVVFDDGTRIDLTPGECTTNGGACKYTPEQLASMPFLLRQAAADGVQLPWGSPAAESTAPQPSIAGSSGPVSGSSSPGGTDQRAPRESRPDDGRQDAGQSEDDSKRPRRDPPTDETPGDSGDDEGEGSESGSEKEPSDGGGSDGGGEEEDEYTGDSDVYSSSSSGGSESGSDGGGDGGCSAGRNRNDCRDGNGSDGNAGKGNDDKTKDKKKPKS